MRLFELEDNDVLTGFYDPSEDKLAIRNPAETRKDRIPLKALNRLKRMRALKGLEDSKRQDLLGIIYAVPDEGGGGMGGGGSPF